MQSFLNPNWAWLGLLAVPLVLLYLLRQKRPDQPISSTLLWSKALADLRASHPFQRFRKNLLLLIQIAALVALVLSLMRPVLQGHARQASAGVIVISAGASMQTLEVGGGGEKTRLDLAKAQAHRLVDSMRSGDQLMLLADGGGTHQIRSGFTSSKEELNRLIEQITPTDMVPDLSETLLLATTRLRALVPAPGAAAGSGTAATDSTSKIQNQEVAESGLTAGNIWLISDGVGIQVPPAADLQLRMRYVRVGQTHNNVGIVRVGVVPQPPTPGVKGGRAFQVFVGLLNAGLKDRDVYVGVRPYERVGGKEKYGKFLAVSHVVIPGTKPGAAVTGKPSEKDQGGGTVGTSGVTFENIHPAGGDGNSTVLQVVVDTRSRAGTETEPETATIDRGGGDALSLDNAALVILPAARKMRVVLVSKGNLLLENYLKTVARLGEVEPMVLAPERAAEIGTTNPDFVIFDATAPTVWPACDCLVIHPPENRVEGFNVQGQLERPAVLRWLRDDPLLNYVELSDLRIARAAKLVSDPAESDLRELISSTQGPLLAERRVGGVRRYYLTFNPLTESNWWMQPSLLVFLENTLRTTAARRFVGVPQMLTTGQPASIWLPEGGVGGGGGGLGVQIPDGAVVLLEKKNRSVQDPGASKPEPLVALDFPLTERVGLYHVVGTESKAVDPSHEAKGGETDFGDFVVNLTSRVASNITPRHLEMPSGDAIDLIDAGKGGGGAVAQVNREIWPWIAAGALLVLLLEWWVYHKRWA